jgi:hypothetical protein
LHKIERFFFTKKLLKNANWQSGQSAGIMGGCEKAQERGRKQGASNYSCILYSALYFFCITNNTAPLCLRIIMVECMNKESEAFEPRNPELVHKNW